MTLKFAKWPKIGFILLIFGTVFIFACVKEISNSNDNQMSSNEKSVVAPTVTPVEMPENIEVLGDNEKTDKKFHEKLYQRKLKILSVIRELTNLNKSYVNELLPDKEHEERKKKIFRLVDSLTEIAPDPVTAKDNASDLITLAEICQVIRESELSKATSSYEIAFFYSVKVIATKHKDNESILNELKGWVKKYNFDGGYAFDFLFALAGKDPKYLYGEEVTTKDLEDINNISKSIIWR